MRTRTGGNVKPFRTSPFVAHATILFEANSMASQAHSVHHRSVEVVHWPLFGLQVRTPRLVLRYPDDADLASLAEVAARGVHDPATMPFAIPWTDVPSPLQQRKLLQYHWSLRSAWSEDCWELALVCVVDDEVVGVQGMIGKDFRALRQVETGSWIGVGHQGQGHGKEMRAAVLHLAFAGLGAELALSGAWHDNARSLSVSRSLGYEVQGTRRMLRRDEADLMVGLKLSRERWEERRRDDISIVGLDSCLALFGVG